MLKKSTQYELANNVRSYMVNALAECISYDWSSEFKISKINEVKEKLNKEVPFIDFSSMSTEQLSDLGFCLWDEDCKFLLIPLWAYGFLKCGTELHCISGERKTVTESYQDNDSKDYIDNDVRFGCIAYGIIPADVR